ncbi:nuclear transport factor 2 family protein [Longispora albida]|uniref:nuclear transport factor 2 family protein n=1 Tax=Longispora albida TaxID=203523 RepID=UPI00035D53B7|nr:nuclear transport factor 2 family protein [Longispora albida]
MSTAREVMDRLTELLTTSGDMEALGECFAEDAVALTPEGEWRGREAILGYWRTMLDAIPESAYTPEHKYDVGDTAIDEGYWGGVNSGPIAMPDGSTIPGTGKTVKIRGTDLATVNSDGKITEYRLYYDQLAFMEQVGLSSAP